MQSVKSASAVVVTKRDLAAKVNVCAVLLTIVSSGLIVHIMTALLHFPNES